MIPLPATCTAFEGHRRIASGPLPEVALAVRQVLARGERAPVLIFDNITSRPVEFDLRGTPEEILARLTSEAPAEQPAPIADAGEDDAPRGRGRPKLGVVAREVTLLPRHWDWLNGQSGGASVALRKLVEAARLAGEDKDRQRAAQEAVYRFMTALAGNLPDYEDATRALYADDRVRFEDIVVAWPEDVRNHTLRLAADAFFRHP
ncbi:hypothetical protein AYM40_00790 [Paraburkholderia phytofirmans OLGA172]|uniref:DUF2239 domain-containing protein n=1 Tax=Paraburkholderia phytofirmans OLGA172 TaxID=1417228 RepID=A0A160FG78_9BURK|nr:DUF2239 family protein [Paraburkholderia phytofirmans]ANB71051.1 hypothetical protein AYM40_00790 [Paraburkholderia phytofirmans OLGA172]